MSLYSEAVVSVQKHREQRHAELLEAARLARVRCIEALRKAAIEGVDLTSPVAPVCVLLSRTLEVGRDDGYPRIRLPTETAKVLKAAAEAGLLEVGHGKVTVGVLRVFVDGTGVYNETEIPEWNTDYSAWSRLTDYTNGQKTTDL